MHCPESPLVGLRRMVEALTLLYALILEIATHWPYDPTSYLRMVLRTQQPPSDKILHFIAYAILAALLWACVRLRAATLPRATAWVIAIIAVWAAVDEATQPFFYRAAERLDWVYDMGGAALGCAVAVLGDRLLAARPRSITAPPTRDTLLVVSQVYPPDPAAVGQHLADATEEMVRRGWRVVVYTARRGYDDPSVLYPSAEIRRGVDVRRLPLSSFGKSSIGVRLVAQSLFMAQAVVRGLFIRRLAGILVSTSPPFAGFGGTIISWIRRMPLIWWAMDINPDQMVTSGRIGAHSFVARIFDWMNRRTLARASAVIVLDDYMKERMRRKADVADRMHVIPPWPLENHLEIIPHESNSFRHRHGLDGKHVVMYSGNAGYSTPLATLLAAAKRLEGDATLRFVFIGGGVVKREIDEMVARDRPPNILTLPYQPLETIRYSLSAGDVHVISIADEGVGVVHPCKIYGAMALGKPVLALTPLQSHAADIVRDYGCGWSVQHGDVDTLMAVLRGILEMPRENLEAMGRAAINAVNTGFSHARLLGAVCDVIEGSMIDRTEHRS